eukprot:scaffold818_cov388-Pavlova_lutheri.AAC.11
MEPVEGYGALRNSNLAVMESCYTNDGAGKGRSGRAGNTRHRFADFYCAIVRLRMEGLVRGSIGKGDADQRLDRCCLYFNRSIVSQVS